jgi:hypothetical protein
MNALFPFILALGIIGYALPGTTTSSNLASTTTVEFAPQTCEGCARRKDPNDPDCKVEVKASYTAWDETCTDDIDVSCIIRTCTYRWKMSARITGCSSTTIKHVQTSPPGSTSYPNASAWTTIIAEPFTERYCGGESTYTGTVSSIVGTLAVDYSLSVGCTDCD